VARLQHALACHIHSRYTKPAAARRKPGVKPSIVRRDGGGKQASIPWSNQAGSSFIVGFSFL
jgi:hypothetical protein